MNFIDLQSTPVLVVGAGIMGVGIAQVAAQAGHEVMLFDLREGAATDSKKQLTASLNALVTMGRLSAEAVAQTLARIAIVGSLHEAANAGLVVEAIVEKLEAKRGLFRELEAIGQADFA